MKLPLGSVVQNHKGQFGIVMPGGKIAWPFTLSQVRKIIDDPTFSPEHATGTTVETQ
jgi:hypothetical protein